MPTDGLGLGRGVVFIKISNLLNIQIWNTLTWYYLFLSFSALCDKMVLYSTESF